MWIAAYVIFTILASAHVIIAITIMLIWAIVEWLRKRNLAILFGFSHIAAGFAIGMLIAWSFVVLHEGWTLSFIETINACHRSDIYGGIIEGAAEDYVFFTLFFGDVGAIFAGFLRLIGAWHRRHIALSN
jgi:hypothetical protein